jgi:hypothetical protein
MLDRWETMYRKLFNKFFYTDFIHTDDHIKMLTDMNARIDFLESNITAELASIQAGVTAHTHPVSTSGGPGTAAPAVAPIYTSAFAPTTPVPFDNTNTLNKNQELFAKGPGPIPLVTGVDPDSIAANTQAALDVGI